MGSNVVSWDAKKAIFELETWSVEVPNLAQSSKASRKARSPDISDRQIECLERTPMQSLRNDGRWIRVGYVNGDVEMPSTFGICPPAVSITRGQAGGNM